MRKMKKKISLVLAILMIVGGASTVFAHTSTPILDEEPKKAVLGELMTIEEAIAQGFEIVCISELIEIGCEHMQYRGINGWFHLARGHWTYIGTWINPNDTPRRILIVNQDGNPGSLYMRLVNPWPWGDAYTRALPPGIGAEFTIGGPQSYPIHVMAPLASGPFHIVGSWTSF